MTANETPSFGLPYHNDSPHSQGARLLEHLKAHLKITTLDARNKLGIMHPAQRVLELRRKGAPILTDHAYQIDEMGMMHRLAVYIWRGGEPAQADLFETHSNG